VRRRVGSIAVDHDSDRDDPVDCRGSTRADLGGGRAVHVERDRTEQRAEHELEARQRGRGNAGPEPGGWSAGAELR
jgi:hypothetical protein